MLNGFDPNAPRFLADLARIQERSQRAERQISSGVRLETASDDPQGVIELLRLRSRIETNTQVQTNLGRVKAQVDSAESAMREAVAIVERARVVGAQNSTTGALDRRGSATEAQRLHERLLALVSTTSEGRFIFSGDGESGPSYVADSTQPSGVRLVAATTTSTILVADENQTTFSASKTASELFDAPGADNAFQALNELATALANDNESQVQAVMPKIQSALDHLNRQLAFYGHTQNRVTSAIDSAKKSSVLLQTELSRVQDTDLPAAILELNTANLHHQTALAAHAQLAKISLFDYLG